MRVTGIYKITNLINGKVYIGQSVNIWLRYNSHRSTVNTQKSSNTLYRDIAIQGYDNFTFEVVEECHEDELNSREIHYIEKYDAYNKGYNQTRGGAGITAFSVLNEQTLAYIKEQLEYTDEPINDIANSTGSSFSLIYRINKGEVWYDEKQDYPIRKLCPGANDKKYCSECGIEVTSPNSQLCHKCAMKGLRIVKERPTKENLAHYIVENGFEGAGRHYGVTGNAIKKWCKSYNIPHKKKEIIEWYGKMAER